MPASSGAPRGLTRPTPGCSAMSTAGACSRSGRAPRMLRAGCAPRAPTSSPSTCPTASSSTLAASTRRPASTYRWCRQPSRHCPSRRDHSTWPSRLSVRCRSSSTSRARCARCARVLRPGGRFVFSVVHPTRWMFPDDPTRAGLRRHPVVLRPHALRRDRDDGQPTYVEPHHTMGDWVDAIARAGMTLDP